MPRREGREARNRENSLAEGLNKQDFADLVAYLESLKQGTDTNKK